MPRVIKRWPSQIVHRGIDDNERQIATAWLDADNLGKQHSGVASDNATGLEHQADAPVLGHARNHRSVIGWLWRIVACLIANAQATTQIDMGNLMSRVAQFLNEDTNFFERCFQRFESGQLATDMESDAAHVQPG